MPKSQNYAKSGHTGLAVSIILRELKFYKVAKQNIKTTFACLHSL